MGDLCLAQTGDAGATGRVIRCGRGGDRGPRRAAPGFFHTRGTETRAGSKGAGTGRGSKAGRRPLLGPPARLSRALSQKIGAPSMHTPGHTRGARPSTKRPGGPRRGVIVGRRASRHFTTRPGGDQTRNRGRDTNEAVAYGACLPRTLLRRSSENNPSTHSGE